MTVFKRYAPVWVTLAIIAGLLLLRPWESQSRGVASEPSTAQATAQRAAPEVRGESPSEAEVEKTRAKNKVTARERERYRRAIGRSVAERSKAKPPATPEGAEPEEDRAAAEGGGGLKDRSDGQLSRLMKDLQEDVMPLADECYTQALERDPNLAGGLGLQFAIIGDEDIGGLVESVELEEDSDIQDAEMIECMRETLLSTLFPAPDDSGSAEVRLTLQFSPDEVD